jgi:hypothetical protein
MNNTSLIFDGANFSFRAVSVYKGLGGLKLFQIDKERVDFFELLAINFISYYYWFIDITNRIIITKESKSW